MKEFYNDGPAKVEDLVKVLEVMPRDFDVEITTSCGSKEILKGTKVLDNVKYFAFDVFYTSISDPKKAPEGKNLKVGELLDMLKDVPANYNVGIIDDGSIYVNEMAVTAIGLSTDMANTTEDYVIIDTSDNDDEERFGGIIKY